MPMLHVTMPAGVLAADNRQALRTTMAATLRKWEGAPDITFFRKATWSRIDELPADPATNEPLRVNIDVTVPAGVMSDQRKAALIRDLIANIRAAAAPTVADRLLPSVLIHEQPAGTWGVAGHIVPFAEVTAVMETFGRLQIRRLPARVAALALVVVRSSRDRRRSTDRDRTAPGIRHVSGLSLATANPEPLAPIVQLTMPTGILTDGDRQALRKTLATTVRRRHDTTDLDRSGSIRIDELPGDAFGSTEDNLSRFRIDVTVPAISSPDKAAMVRDLTADIRTAAGLAVTDGARVWVFIHEQPRTPDARTEAGSLQRVDAPR
ncbi:tautomerase family protein [Nocardia altamirensis]|uniref:tautomerase family protein n=1 Tax=Nocardia altamirensis TaxID=472158 RepID=UPI0008402B69|nr:hypothetical protein [Nocardia altamirensis]